MATGSAIRAPYAAAAGTPLRDLDVIDLGVVPYAECWDLQNKIASEVAAGARRETLLLLEHPHTYTCGRRGGRDHILATDDVLQREGIVVLDVDRGGDVTYHGPGQLVAYPIINLLNAAPKIDYPGYVRTLEAVLVGTLADFAIDAHTLEGYSGAWVASEAGPEKIAAIGVRVDGRGITTHGIALNVAPDLRFFGCIVPCGITDKGVTSIERVAGQAPAMPEVKAAFARRFAQVFGFRANEMARG
ncbi:MAG TPA: lipoyl(octanoyl) transferase LipB [Chloroflexia bacterium]|nr:lipoyl(octanoyl) transferase LipB [Chloroflexia bacterium]